MRSLLLFVSWDSALVGRNCGQNLRVDWFVSRKFAGRRKCHIVGCGNNFAPNVHEMGFDFSWKNLCERVQDVVRYKLREGRTYESQAESVLADKLEARFTLESCQKATAFPCHVGYVAFQAAVQSLTSFSRPVPAVFHPLWSTPNTRSMTKMSFGYLSIALSANWLLGHRTQWNWCQGC